MQVRDEGDSFDHDGESIDAREALDIFALEVLGVRHLKPVLCPGGTRVEVLGRIDDDRQARGYQR